MGIFLFTEGRPLVLPLDGLLFPDWNCCHSLASLAWWDCYIKFIFSFKLMLVFLRTIFCKYWKVVYCLSRAGPLRVWLWVFCSIIVFCYSLNSIFRIHYSSFSISSSFTSLFPLRLVLCFTSYIFPSLLSSIYSCSFYLYPFWGIFLSLFLFNSFSYWSIWVFSENLLLLRLPTLGNKYLFNC